MTDFSQKFLPPINHLVGGNGAWDQNPTGTNPFSSPLNGDLYDNLAKSPGLLPFSVSAMGNPDRERYAADQFNRQQSSLFPEQRSSLYDEYGKGMWNAQQNMFGPMRGFMQNNPSFPNTPNNSIVPYVGGSSQWNGGMIFSPSQMYGGGAGGSMLGGGADIVKDTNEFALSIREAAKSLKEDFTPALQGTVKMLGGGYGGTTGPDINIGGFGGGGFGGYLGAGGGGGGVPFYSGGGGGGFNNGNLTGYEPGFPNMNDGAYDGGGFGLRAPGMFKIRQGYSMFIRPAMNEMNAYMNQSASQAMMLQQSGMIGYGDMMGGQYGDIMRRESAGQEFQLAMGRNVYSAYGSVLNSAMGGDAGRSMFGALGAIGQVSAGAAWFGAGVGQMFGPVGALIGGLGAGGIAATLGIAGYAADSAKDPYAIGAWQNALLSGQSAGSAEISNFRGMAGTAFLGAQAAVGTLTPEQKRQYQNANQYYQQVNQFAAGGMSTQDFRAWASQNGYNPASAVSAGLEQFYSFNAQNFGWEREGKNGMLGQQDVLGFDLMLNPNRLPDSMPQRLTMNAAQNAQNRMAGAGLFYNQMSLGSDFNKWMQGTLPSMAGAMGVGQNDQGGLFGLTTMYTSRAADIQAAGGNVALWQQQMQSQISPIGQINQARYRAGYGSVLGLDNYAALDSNPYIQSDVENIDAARYGYQADSPGFASNVSNPLLNRASYYSRSGRPQISGRIQSMLPQLNRMYSQAEGYGQDISQALRGYSEIAATNEQQGAVVGAIASGDRLALAQNASLLGDIRYQTIDPNSGLPAMQKDMSRAWYNAVSQDQGSLFRLSYNEAMGGTNGMEDRIRDLGRGLDQYQFNQGMVSRNVNYGMMTGGATGLSAQGYALGGDALSNVSALFQSQGMSFNRGNGMGYWQLQDAGTMLDRQQQQYGYNYQGQMMGINQQQFNLSNAYQQQNMTISRGQQVTQEGWQSQDLSMNRNKMELSFGWQMEDFDRNIRFSRGRDRIDLERQQGRAAIMHSLDETQQGNEESRHKTEMTWSKEEFDRKKEYFDQSKSLQQQQLDLEKQRFEKQGEWMKQQWNLEDQKRLLDRQGDELQYKMATDMAIAVKKVTDQSNLYKDGLTAISREYDEVNARIDISVKKYGLLKAAVDAFNGEAPTDIFPTTTPSAGTTSAPRGGGPSPAPQIMSSRGSSGGSNNEVVAILTKIHNVLSKGIVNATIYNDSSPVKVGDIQSQAKARFKPH